MGSEKAKELGISRSYKYYTPVVNKNENQQNHQRVFE